MDIVTYQILKRLRQGTYVPAAQLAEAAEVSERTIRSRIKELADELACHGASLSARPKYGYLLEISDQGAFYMWSRTLSPSSESSNDRILQLLVRLMNCAEYVKLDDLCEQMYVSRNTLSADLKQAEELLGMFHLRVDKRPNHGIRLEGSEMNRRRCIVGCLNRWELQRKWDETRLQSTRALAELSLRILHEQGLRISEISLQSLILYLYVGIQRVRDGFLISVPPEEWEKLNQRVGDRAWKAARSIASEITLREGITFPEEEVLYFALHVGSKTSPSSLHQWNANLVISSRIDAMVVKMLAMVYSSMGVDFRDNLELRMSLNQHLVSFDIRMVYGIPIQNPMLLQFRMEYGFAYAVAAAACTVLQEEYHTEVPEDEIGYIATLFALALEKKDKPISKKNIIMVCASGRGSSQLFIYRYKQLFGQYLNNIYECSVFALPQFDFKGKDIDYVFTTIPLDTYVPVPVFEISMFLSSNEVNRYRQLFESDGDSFLYRFYDRNLFLPHIHAETKEEVLTLMCSHARQFRDIPEDFEESVFLRERMGQTDFGNLVAIPHPQRIITKDCFAVVGLLDKPIWWGHYEVQAVFLTSHSEEHGEDVERFYDRTTSFLCDGDAVRKLIKTRNFDELIHLLQQKHDFPQ